MTDISCQQGMLVFFYRHGALAERPQLADNLRLPARAALRRTG
jgi:hypothetical protein